MDALQPKPPGPRSAAIPGASPQQAVKMLSLRVPERASQGAIAPLPLLTSKGSQVAGASGLDSMIAALMQAFRQQPVGQPGQGPPTGPTGSYAGDTRGYAVPTLPSGSDNTSTWPGRERDLGNRPAPPQTPDGVLYDSGTGFNPIPEQPRAEPPRPAPSPSYPVPSFTPGQQAPDNGPPEPPSLFDNGPSVPQEDTTPLWDWRRDKYGDGLDIQSLL